MRRTARDNRDIPRPKPVEKITLSESHVKLRLVLTIVLLLAGAGLITYAISSLLSGEAGWNEITSDASEYHCGEDFSFLYELGRGDVPASEERRAITALYSDATELAFQVFTPDIVYEGAHNIAYLNRHPNEAVEVDPLLYQALSLVREYGDRCIYLAPVFVQYDDLFFCTDDAQAVDFDPRLNPEVADSYAEIAAFACDPESVDVELLENNRVRLKVSEEYLQYAEEQGIDRFVDFCWMKNAFIADYLAEVMISNGYTHGCLSSYDGFSRNLDGSGQTYSLALSNRVGQTLYAAARMEYQGPAALVVLRDSGPDDRYYTFQNGEIRSLYLDVRDGVCKNAVSELVCYSRALGCAETLLNMIPVYIADPFQPEALSEWKDAGIYSIYCQESIIFYNDPDLTLTELYNGEGTSYSAELIS